MSGWGGRFLEGRRRLKGTLESIEDRNDTVRFGCLDRSLWLLHEGSWEGGKRLCQNEKSLFQFLPAALPLPSSLHSLGPPSALQQAGEGICLPKGQCKWERTHPRKNRVSCQEGLGNSQTGQDCQERLGWGYRAGPFRLEEPVYLLPGVGLCSEGRRQWLEYIKPHNMSQ